MAGKKISELPVADNLAGAVVPVVQDGSNKKAAGELFATASQGVKADTAIQGSTGSVDNAILRADGTGGKTAQSSAVTISDDGRLGLGKYTEAGITLTSVAGVLTIPIDGRAYIITLTENITSVLTTAPTAPECSSAVVTIIQDATGNRAFPFPATWRWPGKAVTAITLTANAQSELLLNTTPAGDIIARVTPNIGVVA